MTTLRNILIWVENFCMDHAIYLSIPFWIMWLIHITMLYFKPKDAAFRRKVATISLIIALTFYAVHLILFVAILIFGRVETWRWLQ